MASLTGVYLRNFQSIKNPTFLQLDRLCFLYGPNSAGKSSILDAIDLVERAVTGNTDGYQLGFFFKKNQDAHASLGVGVEIILTKSESYYDESGSHQEWWETPDQRGDYVHQEFFSKLREKRCQIEFGEDGNCIKIAVEGQPLFEFESGGNYYDHFYKKTDNPEDEYDLLFNRLIIYKKNLLNKIYDVNFQNFSSDSSAYLPSSLSPYFLELFAEEDNEKLIIYGLRFDAGKDLQTNIVDVDSKVEDIIFAKYENLKKDRSDDIEYQKFVEEHFNENTEEGKKAARSRKNIYWNLEKIARDFEKLLKGFFFEIEHAIKRSHVRGDRQLLNSRNCFSYPRHQNIDLKNCLLSELDPMARFARFLAEDKLSFQWPKPSLKGDFINKSLIDYLISLRGYEIYPETLELNKKGDKDSLGNLIYLKIKHKNNNKLGFQDVGSGISFVFPILTSLWASKLSFIEQPELHLHPSAQCELGDVFIAAYNSGSMAIVESHSEHMLLRILRRIRDTTNNYLLPKELNFSANDLKIYYFNPDANGYTTVKEIRVDKYGELLNTWPGGFFSERDRELFGE